MPRRFSHAANLTLKTALLALPALVVFGVGYAFTVPRTDYANWRHIVRDQPVPFSHEHHVAGLGIDCRYCHTTVERLATAGMPPTYTCMSCHSQIWTNAGLLAPVRESLAENKPIHWHRVHDLPDYVYFNHAIHIAKGVGCSTCHGHVDRMPLMEKVASLTMGWCLDCHRNPGPNLRPRDAIFDTEWQRGPDTPSPEALMAQYHVGGRNLTECGICHR